MINVALRVTLSNQLRKLTFAGSNPLYHRMEEVLAS